MRAAERTRRQTTSLRDGLAAISADRDPDFRPDHGGNVNPDLAADPAAHGHDDRNAVPHDTPNGHLIPHALPHGHGGPEQRRPPLS